MRKLISLLLLCGFSLAAVPIPMLSPAPEITGTPGHPGWKNALKLKYCDRNATAYLGRTAAYLYVAVESEHGSMENRVDNATSHDDAVYDNDCLDIFFNTSGKQDYYQIIANVRGTVFDHYKDELGRANIFWDSGTQAAGSYGKDSFYIEMKIPMAALTPHLHKLSMAICSYLRWSKKGANVLGEYHKPETFTTFDIPESYPVQLKGLHGSRFAGIQPYRFELENTFDEPLVLTGNFNGIPVEIKLPAKQRGTLECYVTQTAGRVNVNVLTLNSVGGREVLRAYRQLIPDSLFKAVPVSDIIYQGEPVRIRVTVNEQQTEPVTMEYTPGAVRCIYKGETAEIPYTTIDSPWSKK